MRRFLWDGRVIPTVRTKQAIEQSRRLFTETACGLWGAWSVDGSNLVGFGGLWPFREPPVPELLYGVAEHFWGRGYATEIAGAVIKYCFDALALPVVCASTGEANVASIHVLKKLGFGLVRRGIVDGLDMVFYEARRPTAPQATSAEQRPETQLTKKT